VGPASTVGGAVLTLLANDRSKLDFHCCQHRGRRKITPALEGLAVWCPVATRRSSSIRGLSYWVLCYSGNNQISQGPW
jgi:hypothetical protein